MVERADASDRTKAIDITGNEFDNLIAGSAGNDTLAGMEGDDSILGGKGDDIIIGGLGNDSLWGNDGENTFIYSDGDGKDTINGFTDDDMLQITGTFSGKFSKVSNEVSLRVGNTANAITLKKFTASSFNINGDTYVISGNKLVRN